MILDRENIFYEGAASGLTDAAIGNIIATGGDSVNQMYLYASPLDSGSINLAIETDDEEGMGGAVTLATVAMGTEPVRLRLPIGVQKFLRIKGSGASSPTKEGNVTIALVVDVDFK